MPWVRSSWSLLKRSEEGFLPKIDITFHIKCMYMKTITVIILDEDMLEEGEGEVSEGKDAAEVVKVVAAQEAEVVEMVSHPMALLVNLIMNEENLGDL